MFLSTPKSNSDGGLEKRRQKAGILSLNDQKRQKNEIFSNKIFHETVPMNT